MKLLIKFLYFVGESSQDEEEDVKPVTVKFAQQESSEAKARRMASFDYLYKKQQEEAWLPLQYHNISVRTVIFISNVLIYASL